MIKTPLRYPGGKSKAIKVLNEYFFKNYDEMREPFVGGGSIFIHLLQQYPNKQYWINDIYYNLYCFWVSLRDRGEQLSEELYEIKKKNNTQNEIKKLFYQTKEEMSNFDVDFLEVAKKFFIINKCSFSGTSESGGFSPQASEQRFTFSTIQKLKKYLS